MNTLETVLLILLVMDAVALAGLVLLQQGKGADVGAAFGSGSANTVFGSAGSTSFLTKATAWLAIGFFLISFGLAYAAKERVGTLPGIDLPEVGEPPAMPATEEAEGEAEGEAEESTAPETDLDSDLPDV